jgi:hypothetical protein
LAPWTPIREIPAPLCWLPLRIIWRLKQIQDYRPGNAWDQATIGISK